MEQSVVVTFLPQDSDPGGDFLASLFIAVHLTPDGPGATAADFKAFGDWPAVIAEATILVEKRGGETIDLRADTSNLRSDLWTTYIAPLPVNGWVYRDLSDTDLRSFSAQAIHALAKGLYLSVAAASEGDHPDPLAGGLRNLGAAYAELGGKTREERDARVDELLRSRAARRRAAEAGSPGEPGSFAPHVTALTPTQALQDSMNAALDLAEARRFYDRPEARDPDEDTYERPDPAYVPPVLDKPEPDFHDVLGSLADHPELLGALGIIIPIALPAGFVGGGGDFRATIDHPALAGNPIAEQPWTRSDVDGQFFQPVSETGDLVHGLLGLDDPDRYDVSQVDIDSTALLVEQRVANVYSIADAVGGDEPVTGDLPALRSSGFTVSRLRRAMILADRIARSSDNADKIAVGADVVLFAEDLIRGFRIDVNDGTEWRSLMLRDTRYLDRTSRAERFAVPKQEAYLKASSVTSVPGSTTDRTYLHEAVFGWDGWSLAMPRPGKHIPKEAGAPGVSDNDEPFPGPFELEVETSLVLGTLPRLRYGWAYRFRARTVDLTGHSTVFAKDDPSTGDHVFRRFQPISHPVVVPRHAFTEGESAHRLVIRSGVDAVPEDPTGPVTPVDPSTYAGTLAGAAGPRTFAVFRADSQRHLAPPKTSQLEAELHGRFDDAIGLAANGGSDAVYRAAFARAQREAGTLADLTILSATDPNATTPVAGIHLVPPLAQDGDFTPAQLDAILAGLERGEAPEPGFTVIHDTDELQIPYLPDPLAAGITLRFVGGGTAAGWSHTQPLPFDVDEWPDLATYRLVLVDGPAPTVVPQGHELVVSLPPGGTALVRTSSSLADASMLDRLGMWDWISSTQPAADVPRVIAGEHQMLTPSEDIALVHATQRPLLRPSLRQRFRAIRTYGATFSKFAGILRSQSASTGRLDVEGTWSEWVDDPAQEAPELVAGRSGHAFDLVVADGSDDLDLAAAEGGTLKHEFGDHKHRRIAYAVIATTRFREYLPAAVTGDVRNLQVVGPSTTIHVPNSVRPAVPIVHSIIPTFTWTDEPEDPLDPLVRGRSRAGGLRVWLERPWYTSGEDEMLGVVLVGADGIVRATDLRRQWVSLWGKDPIRLNGELAAAIPRPRDFSGPGLLQMDRLTLDETSDRHPGVSVVGHPVRYAAGRDKWYADLVIDPGEAYWPFLRLGLVRFQPFSVANAHISPVVVADFVQLTNRRTAAITRPGEDQVRVTVTGIEERRPTVGLTDLGPAAAFDAAVVGRLGRLGHPRGIRAWVERRGPSPSDLDWHRVGDVVELGRIDEDEVMRVWRGDVELVVPLPIRRPGTDPEATGSDWRLVLTEWESLPLDVPSGTGQPVERIVYIDRFPI
jgi:hypothetical protein